MEEHLPLTLLLSELSDAQNEDRSQATSVLFKFTEDRRTVTYEEHGIGVPCSWARGCAVPGGLTPPLERRRARARVGRSRVACIGVCAVSARAG
jgi:hypothetical protein